MNAKLKDSFFYSQYRNAKKEFVQEKSVRKILSAWCEGIDEFGPDYNVDFENYYRKPSDIPWDPLQKKNDITPGLLKTSFYGHLKATEILLQKNPEAVIQIFSFVFNLISL